MVDTEFNVTSNHELSAWIPTIEQMWEEIAARNERRNKEERVKSKDVLPPSAPALN
jgi:hypothetical protein